MNAAKVAERRVPTILCAIDLNESARPVTTVAASLARSLHAKLELLHVVHLPPGLALERLSGNAIVDVRAAAAAALDARVAELRETGLDVGGHVALDGIHEGIFNRIGEVGADLVVLGTHARHGAARLFLGSVAERVVREATCPVVVVPPSTGGRLARESFAGSLKILAAVDVSPATDAALAWLRVIDGQVACDLGLVHLYWPPREHERLGLGETDASGAEPEVVAALTRELESHVAEHLGRSDVPLQVRPFLGAEEEPLVREAEAAGADLLLVGTSQDRHSTALATVRGSSLPVVCVPSAWLDGAPDRKRRS